MGWIPERTVWGQRDPLRAMPEGRAGARYDWFIWGRICAMSARGLGWLGIGSVPYPLIHAINFDFLFPRNTWVYFWVYFLNLHFPSLSRPVARFSLRHP